MGGAERQTLTFLKHSASVNIAADLVILGRNATFERLAAEVPDVATITFGTQRSGCLDLNVLRGYRSLIRAKGYDIVHLFGLRHEIASRWISQVLGGCTVVSGIRGMESHRHRLHSRLNQLTGRWVDLWISNSEATRALFVARDHLPAEKIVVVPNGVEVPEALPDRAAAQLKLRELFAIPAGRRIVGCVANILPDKRQEDLVAACRTLADAGVDVDLLLVGRSGDHAAAVEALAAALGQRERVHFCGYRDDVHELVAGFDVFALASRKEGLPTAVLEAMAAGVPVVATAVAEIPRVVVDGVTGYVVPVGDCQAMAQRIGLVLGDDDLRDRLGRAGHARARTRYGQMSMVQNLAAVYDQVLRAKAANS